MTVFFFVDKIESERVYFLKLERELVELNLEIKSCVGLAKADPEKCVELMEQYQRKNHFSRGFNLYNCNNNNSFLNFSAELKVTPTMLKKNPNCVETMKRLRKYVGNAKAWNMADEERIKFDFQAQQIRTKAEQIYNQFKVCPLEKSFKGQIHNLPLSDHVLGSGGNGPLLGSIRRGGQQVPAAHKAPQPGRTVFTSR